MKIYDFPRSSASYRVRIICNLKNIEAKKVLVDFSTNAQRSSEYLSIAPSGLVPSLVEDDGFKLSQSIAIARYLDRLYPLPRLIPEDAKGEAIVMEMSLAIACDIHPINNLRVLKYLENTLNVSSERRNSWYSEWVQLGFVALESRVQSIGGTYCVGEEVTLADICLVPQMFNARRFNVDLDSFPRLTEIDSRLRSIPSFEEAAP